jgi:hypothetical protein
MMSKDDYQHFVCIAAGDNPMELMEEYSKLTEVEPYVVYKYEDAENIKKLYISSYKKQLENCDNEFEREYIENTIQDLEEMSSDDFYYKITDGLILDEDTGDALSNKNKKGKFSYFQLGKMFSMPFLTKDGREVFQAKKGKIDWDKINLNGGNIYERAWEMVMEGSSPKDDYEQQIYDNMHDKEAYFMKFENKENYVISNTAFWGYAFVSDMTGWQDASDTEDQFIWMRNFYDMFIKNLPDDTLLTIYECTK